MKSPCALITLALLLVLGGLGSGCGDDAQNPGDGTVSGCQGSYAGSYTGDDAGTIGGELDASGVFVITFVTAFGDTASTAMVTEAGAVSGDDNGVVIDGSLNLDSCAASGNWTNTLLNLSGTWTVVLR